MSVPADTDLTLGDYLGVLKRRGGLLCGVFAATVLVGVWIAYRMPPMYASSGVLLAEQPEVPEHVVRSTVPYNPDDRVRIITQRVLTNENLAKIIEEQRLYAPLEPSSPPALQEFRANLALSAADPDILENLLGPSQAADAMAFSLSFLDARPEVARDVTRSLVRLYLDENQRARREQADETTRFLTDELNRLDAEIADREQRLAAFKRENIGNLPAEVDRQLLDRAQRDLDVVEQDIRALQQRRDLAASALAQLSPYATLLDESGQPILGPEDRRTLLERRYAQLSAIYAQDHPDVLKVRRELDMLAGTGGGSANADAQALRAELAAREEELAQAKTRYSADHPDVLRLERSVTGLRAALARPAARAAPARAPDNPEYIQRQVQVRAAQADLDAAVARRQALNERLLELERRAQGAPEVERDLASLTRGYEQLLTQYSDVQGRLREAQMAANLELEGRGDRFTVLQTPQLPTSPESPNRLALLLLTLMLAFALSTGAVAVAERADSTVRHARDVAEHFGAPPLVAIPFVFGTEDYRRQSRRRLITATASCLWLGAIVFLVMTPA